MSDTPRPLDDDRRLIDALLDDTLGSDQADTVPDANDLLARLEREPAACDYLVERAVLHVGLRQLLRRRRLADWAVSRAQADVTRPHDAAGAIPRGSRRLFEPYRGWLAAAACLALVVAGWQLRSRPYATVTTGIGTAGLATGRTVRGETHELTAGVLELKTRRGADLVIEAPAAFRFESPQRLRLTKGRIAADVPPQAKGFTVVTPSGEAIDLGTRFAVDVPASGEAEVHVFDGEVVAHAGAHMPKNLRDGEAISLATNAARELRTAAFIRGGEVAELAAAVAAGREHVSHDAAARLQADPALVAWLDFEGPDATAGARAMDAAGGQCRIVQGRWPGSRAADFTEMGDHIPIDVGAGEDYPQLTLAAWVRLDRLGAPFQSLYHTDGWEADNPGQAHWMLTHAGVMRLALRGIKLAPGALELQGHPDSRSPVLGEEGRWIHLAAVYDSAAKTARFYVDGAFDSETQLALAPPARLGRARIGNWNMNDRRLSGRIDEFFILGRALGDDEIRAIHASGNPYEVVRR
jgi:hypothetical protein